MGVTAHGMEAVFSFLNTVMNPNINKTNTTIQRFMLVEDNKRFREFLKSYLLPYGIVECESDNGADAVLQYDTCLPDIVLMDVRMDKMDGFTATKTILKRHPTARIIIVSECDEKDFGHRATQAGAIGFVPKDNLDRLNVFFSSA